MCRCGLETCGVALSEFLRIPIHVLQTPPPRISERLTVDLQAMAPSTIEHWSCFRGAFPGAYMPRRRARGRGSAKKKAHKAKQSKPQSSTGSSVKRPIPSEETEPDEGQSHSHSAANESGKERDSECGDEEVSEGDCEGEGVQPAQTNTHTDSCEPSETADDESHELMETIVPFAVPVPHDALSRQSKLEPGEKFSESGYDDLAKWIAAALGRLDSDLQRSLRNFHLAEPLLSVGTACSGTDSPLMMVRAYADAVWKYKALLSTQTGFTVDHAFSCEKNDAWLTEPCAACLWLWLGPEWLSKFETR